MADESGEAPGRETVRAIDQLIDDPPHPGIGVMVVVENDARQLLLYRRVGTIMYPGTWCMPSGGLEPGEALKCCGREFYKGTGLVTDRFDLDALTDVPGLPHLIGFVFRAIGVRGTARNNDPKVHDAMGWFGRHELPKPLMSDVVQWLEIEGSRNKKVSP